MDLLQNLNWLGVGQIILIDLVLGGDNAIVIALACRNLPPALRLKGILWGTVGAVAIRVILVAFAVTLLQMPYLKIVGGVVLFWIGVKLIYEDVDCNGEVHGSDRLLSAVKTIIVADLVMSIDNVVAVASAAEQSGGDHQLMLVVFGILVSIPVIIWGSTLVLKLMSHFPFIVTLGAALLGYLAGAMIVSDVVVAPWISTNFSRLELAIPRVGLDLNVPGLFTAVAVIVIGARLTKRQQHRDS